MIENVVSKTLKSELFFLMDNFQCFMLAYLFTKIYERKRMERKKSF